MHIVVFGAGKSATVLIGYLGRICQAKNWTCTIADKDLKSLEKKISGYPSLKANGLSIENEAERRGLITTADIVISLLPPGLHFWVAQDCVALRKNLLTASYLDAQIKSLESAINEAGLLFIGEMGLDPGIDHMSAMQIIEEIKEKGGTIHSFKSHCGGLIAPESDNNPWHYKISWNPRNIVTAGKAGAVYKENGTHVDIPYEKIFVDCGQLAIPEVGTLAYYPNRDSLSYIPLYQLENAKTFVRTTLRYASFCTGWEKMVAAQLTSDEAIINTDGLSYADFFSSHLNKHKVNLDTADLKEQFNFLGLNNPALINKGEMSTAQLLQDILEDKWKLAPGDKDLIVMLHEFEYTLNQQKFALNSSLVVKGDDELRTAMAKTVGMPLGIAAVLILENKIQLKGLHIPIVKEIYEPVLAELAKEGIAFNETIKELA
ncbi:saccharopine dehydrogenase C-terminal domain-containing protein [Sediminibacterium sp. TEGAF015]|uniref:saccharopine dehydrogenase C-terminal domain-containing protein n=1 Tax=Sediminibacterium sp. TEGAF015 TaxID=575378 RepID=UPI00220F60F6|nr:saccharopine dehydrogenase C-terminal domain-containing protein [Sediminibacterium sp. TEGAF015]BDQ11310.1 saccharopine dehydrogenase [Sediminibacterium sp. TEGAF015]